MRTLLFLLTMLSGQFLWSQSNFSIKTDEAKNPHGLTYWPYVSIIEEDSTTDYLVQKSRFTIPNIKAPGFRLSLTNVFGKTIQWEIKNNKKKKQKIKLTGLKSLLFIPTVSNVGMAERLKDGDTLYILFSSIAAKDTVMEKIAIIKKGGKTIAIQFKGWSNEIHQDMQLVSRQIEAIKKFENDLKSLVVKNDCTEKEVYSLFINGTLIQKVDQSCSFHGFMNLKGQLFIQINQ